MTDNPYSAPVASADVAPNDSFQSWESVTEPLRTVPGWSRFLGFTFVVTGALFCLTIVGAMVGWIPIWIGILLLKSGDNFKAGTAASMNEGIEQLAKVVRIVGTTIVILLVLMLIYVISVLILLAVIGLSAVPAPNPAAF